MTGIREELLGGVLGRQTEYKSEYSPEQLYPVSRQKKREEIGIHGELPFFGVDLWTHFEVSFLNEKGKPELAIAEIRYDAASPYLIESKSMKLYFNSLNQTRFSEMQAVQAQVIKDLTARVGMPVSVRFFTLDQVSPHLENQLPGVLIDDLDVECNEYVPNPQLLKVSAHESVEETLTSNLLKSNCLMTGQPDWGSLQIGYRGPKIDRAALLKYIVSFRNHTEFGEHCAERIFMDLLRNCRPEKLTVYVRYTRRGGIDVNAYRSTEPLSAEIENTRLIRQ
ncbi:MAG: NADPH-dependent 7-cyano-7-deazaguanine reductase QueF [Gammaproteobacteria bacterium]|nr:NADPH-dependent 7-cyano-7-deazaguanine reductase QueF [Gammaproteobacteria bacterium]